ncbi:MAG TPA: peptidase U32 family protein [Paenibacillus sp.]|uniref:peptidase U32 family protein n=1 Tax=Paenibacillus sp. TaxID=58172 RepID=UPI002C3758A1|nr:peptidase U32 family protein [Paenibacillus sp.]HUC91363.1 peptidase U32 family protein [Paenibacillus sp.]
MQVAATKRTELLTTAASMEELRRLAEAGADAFVVGESRYAVRMAGEFDLATIRSAVAFAKPRGVRIYAAVNNLIDNALLPGLPAYLRALEAAGVDAVVFGDPAVLTAARSEAPSLGLHWNAEMTSTNYATANYWGRRGATRVVLARELNMDQVLEFKANTELEVQVQVHGMTNIYHSKRSLIHSYAEHQERSGKPAELKEQAGGRGMESGLYLIEIERPDERYPIYEDENGTHMMSSDDICMLESLHELLEPGVDSVKIEGLLKPAAYNAAVVRAYRRVMDAYYADPAGYRFRDEWLDPIRELQDPHRELSFGFFYKEQVY